VTFGKEKRNATVFKRGQPANAEDESEGSPAPNVTEESDSQEAKAPESMDRTESGISIDKRPEEKSTAFPIVAKAQPTFAVENFVQPQKTWAGRTSTSSAILIDVSWV
jgi:hypothetical protein